MLFFLRRLTLAPSTSKFQMAGAEVHLSVGSYDDGAHLKACHEKNCARCKWAQYKERWQKELPWLDAKIDLSTGLWGLGCRLCAEAQTLKPEMMAKFPVSRHHFSRYEVRTGEIRVDRFRKHGASPAHRTAENLASGKDEAAVAEGVDGFAPTDVEWKSVLAHSKPGNCTADVKDAGSRKKAHMMRWCLSEAFRNSQRQFMKNALCVSLQQDQRGRRFLVRFQAVNSELEVCRGTLELRKVVATPDAPGALGIRQMTLKALEAFCTPSCPPTYGGLLEGAKMKQECDYLLLRDLMGKVECIAADAAGDEQLALRELSGISGPDIVELEGVMGQAFSNLKAQQ